MSCFITTLRENPLGDFSVLLDCMPPSLLGCRFAAERKKEVPYKEWRDSGLGELQNVISPDFLSQGATPRLDFPEQNSGILGRVLVLLLWSEHCGIVTPRSGGQQGHIQNPRAG